MPLSSETRQRLLDRTESLKNCMLARAQGQTASAQDYKSDREALVSETNLSTHLPKLVRTCRNLGEFWAAIKELATYAERRERIGTEFQPLFQFLEFPAEQEVVLDGSRESANKSPQSITNSQKQRVSSRKFSGQTVLVSVGVANYDPDLGFAALPQTTEDAEMVFGAVSHAAGYRLSQAASCILVGKDRDGYVRRTDILKALSAAAAACSEQDRLIFFYSGHGHRIAGLEDLLLVPSDACDDEGADDFLPLSRVQRTMNRSRASVKLILLDCCYSGPETEAYRTKGPPLSNAFVERALRSVTACAVLTSSSAREVSHILRNQPSLFTKHLVDGLSGFKDALVEERLLTIDSLFDYVNCKVSEEARSRQINQTPCKSVDADGMAILCDFKKKSKAPGGNIWTFLANAVGEFTNTVSVDTKTVLKEWKNRSTPIDQLRWAAERALPSFLEDSYFPHLRAEVAKKFPGIQGRVDRHPCRAEFPDFVIELASSDMASRDEIEYVMRLSVKGPWFESGEKLMSLLKTVDFDAPDTFQLFVIGGFDPSAASINSSDWTVKAIRNDSLECATESGTKARIRSDSITFENVEVTDLIIENAANERCEEMLKLLRASSKGTAADEG